MGKPLRARSGQAVIEYLLLLGVLVGILTGVFWPQIQRILSSVDRLQQVYRGVLSQSPRMGIPIGWFGGSQRDFDFAGRFAANGSGPSVDDPPEVEVPEVAEPPSPEAPDVPEPEAPDVPDPGAPNAGAPGDADGGGAGGPRGRGPNRRGGNRGNNGFTDNPDAATGTELDEFGNPRRKGGGGASSEEDSEEGASAAKNKKPNVRKGGLAKELEEREAQEKEQEEEKEKEKKQKDSVDDDLRQQKAVFSKSETRRSRGCQQMDFWTLVKIGLLIALALLVVVVVFSALSKGRSD